MNYQKELEQIIYKNMENDKVPTLLLHSCCGPCSSYVLEYLSNYFNITVLYYNPNISPYDEYQRRMNEQKRLIEEMHFKHKVTFLEGNYDNDRYLQLVKGQENEREGGSRCHLCYRLRLEETAKLAEAMKFDYFTTTLSISPYKNAIVLNEIGKEIECNYQTSYLYADFKKKDGYKRSIELSMQYHLYRQDYCGCIYSKKK